MSRSEFSSIVSLLSAGRENSSKGIVNRDSRLEELASLIEELGLELA